MDEGLDESLRRRLETLSKKSEAKDSARDGLGVEDGSEVVCLRCSKEFIFFSEETHWYENKVQIHFSVFPKKGGRRS